MSGGFINANQAKHNYFINSIIHQETSSIEKDILDTSNLGNLQIIIDNTLITNSNTNTPILTIPDLSSTFTLIDHGFEDGDIVVFSTTDLLPSPLSLTTNYFVLVIDNDTFKVYTDNSNTPIILMDLGEGDLLVKKLLTSELYFQAWKYFYLYPNANTYLTIINEIEEHFRKSGYSITKIEKTTTFNWKLTWY